VGCINGVMRTQILNTLKNKGIEIKEEIYQSTEIKNADAIFCSNVTGVTQFKNIGNKKLEFLDLENLLQLF